MSFNLELVVGVLTLIALVVVTFLSNTKTRKATQIRKDGLKQRKNKTQQKDRATKKAEDIKRKILKDAEKVQKDMDVKERQIVLDGSESLDGLADAWNERLKRNKK